MTAFRTFGTEFECFHPTQDASFSTLKIIRAITAMGYRAKSSNYSGRDYDHWQIKPDGSLTPYGKALEIVAPTLPGTPESFEQVRKVVEWLGANGFDVNKSCGYHVHIGCPDLSPAEQAAVAFRYHLFRNDINAILPTSRHSGSYCQALCALAADKVKQAVNGAPTHWTHAERRVAVNLEHAVKSVSERRIEFRQHSGTLNWTKIFGWYSLMCEFVAETVRLYRAVPAQPAAPAPVPAASPRRTRRGQRTVSHRIGTHQPRVPYIEPGSDYDLFLRAIADNGVVTQADGRLFGWPETRLRVTAHWLRQRGAALVTTERNGELAYVAREGARSRNAIFINEGVIRVRTTTEAVAPVAQPTPVAQPAPVNREAALNAPFEQGLSPTTLAWYRQRREDFGNT